MSGRLRIGTFAGIGLFVHWSFALIILYAATAAAAAGGGTTLIAYAVTQVLGMFFCVTLHEYGHAMAARRYGIGTVDITLLPIGGLARLRRMPRLPHRELVVAVAGPLVNVVIVAGLIPVAAFLFRDEFRPMIDTVVDPAPVGFRVATALGYLGDTMQSPSAAGFVATLLGVNTLLVVFNMIPAFPMDGGRVLRAILAMLTNYGSATRAAAKIGLALAIVMAWLALQTSPPQWVLLGISGFIVFAGTAEARNVTLTESVRGIIARDAMLSVEDPITIDDPPPVVADKLSRSPLTSVPVVMPGGAVVGMLSIRRTAERMTGGVSPTDTAGMWADRDHDTISVDAPLERALPSIPPSQDVIPVVDADGSLRGVIDRETLLARHALRKYRSGP